MADFFAFALRHFGDRWECVLQTLDGASVTAAHEFGSTPALAVGAAMRRAAPSLSAFLDALRASVAGVAAASSPPSTDLFGFILKASRPPGLAVFHATLEAGELRAHAQRASLGAAVAEVIRSTAASVDSPDILAVPSVLAAALKDLPARPWTS